ncbi:MAG: M48 family metalloprotease [Pseudomonadota bacterium]|nr:M48 family metalloprotease [Pseudomonadota bacterium]
MRKSRLFLAATALATAGVAVAQTRSLSPREVAEARQQHPALVAEFGGAETGPRAAYVESVGRRVSTYSGLANPGQAIRFTTLNAAVENAFAVPGGYVYITRQLMGLMNDEAELAFVLGHETGHIAARHSQARQQASQRNSILGVLGAVLGSVVGGGFGNLISQSAQYGSQLRTLSFSRDQEYQADVLGIRYLVSAGYDPLASSSMLAALGRSSALESRAQGNSNRSTPEWAQTHPLNENRTRQAAASAQRTGRAGQGLRNRDAFLAQLDGVIVDDDPEQGIIDGRSFTHPDLRLQFTVPVGYQMQNSARAVTVAGSGGQAQFSTGRFDGNFDTYIGQVLYGLTEGKTRIALGPMQRTTINGLPAAFVTGRAGTSSGAVDVSVMAYRFDANTAYHFVMLSRGGQGMQPFAAMLGSLRRISPAEAAAIRPRVIDVVTVGRGDTVNSLASRMAYRDYRVERFLSLNGLSGGALIPGQKVKLVVYGARAR